jgi:hypothetical protein
MTLSLAIAINVFAMLALAAVLAYVMSHAAKLTPHLGAAQPAAGEPAVLRLRTPTRRARSATPALAPARS